MRRSSITTPAKAREGDHQAAYFDWLKTTYVRYAGSSRPLHDYAFATMNGMPVAGARVSRAKYIAAMKRRGMKDGVSDIVIAFPANGYHGAYFELKRDKDSKVADDQKAWVALMNSVGYYARVVVGYDALVAATKDFLTGKREAK